MATSITAFLIDDEPGALQSTIALLENFFPEIDIVGSATDAGEGFRKVTEIQPDVVFLDINMPEIDGFGFLDLFDERSFEFVFISAHTQYGIEAVNREAFGYLVKPIVLSDLRKVVTRLKKKLEGESISQPDQPTSTRLSIPSNNGLIVLETDQILRLESEGNYTHIHLADGESHLASRNLAHFEERLPNTLFFRTHQSHVINLNAVVRYYRGRGGQVELKDRSVIPVSKARKAALLEVIGFSSE